MESGRRFGRRAARSLPRRHAPRFSRLLLFGVPTLTKSALVVDHDKVDFEIGRGAKSLEVDVSVPRAKLMADHWTSKKLPEKYLGGVGFISIPMRKDLNCHE